MEKKKKKEGKRKRKGENDLWRFDLVCKFKENNFVLNYH